MAHADIFGLQPFTQGEIVVDIVEYIVGPDNDCFSLTDYFNKYKELVRQSLTDTVVFSQFMKYKEYYMEETTWH